MVTLLYYAKKPNDVSIVNIIAYQDGVRKALEARDVALLKQVLETTKHINHPAYKDPWTSLTNRDYNMEKTMIPLVQAVKYGGCVMAELLLQAGAADANMADNDPTNPTRGIRNTTDKFTPLMFAAAAGDLQMCRLLYGYGVDVNAQVQGFWTALHDAASQKHLHIADWLFKHGARLLGNDDQRATRLAAWANKPKLMELFTEQHEQSYPDSQLIRAMHDALTLGAEDSALVMMFHGYHSHHLDAIEDCKLKPMSTVSCDICFSLACFVGSTNIIHTMISYNPSYSKTNACLDHSGRIVQASTKSMLQN